MSEAHRLEKALVVDDDEPVVEHLSMEFERAGYAVLSARNGAAAFDLCLAQRPDLVITDIKMADGSGTDLLSRLAGAEMEMPVVLCITGFADVSGLEIFDKGASGIFRKPLAISDLLGAARHFLRLADRQRWMASELKACREMAPGVSIDSGFLAIRNGNVDVSLTPTELKIVTLLAQSLEQTAFRSAIVERIWGASKFGVNTFNVHLSRLRKKLKGTGLDIALVRTDEYRLSGAPAGRQDGQEGQEHKK